MFVVWWGCGGAEVHPVASLRQPGWGGEGAAAVTARAMQGWMEAGVTETANPAQALLLAAGLLACTGTVVLPVWWAYPAPDSGERPTGSA